MKQQQSSISSSLVSSNSEYYGNYRGQNFNYKLKLNQKYQYFIKKEFDKKLEFYLVITTQIFMLMLTLSAWLQQHTLKIATLYLFTGVFLLVGFTIYTVNFERIKQQNISITNQDDVEFWNCIMIDLIMIATTIVGMAALDQTFDDYHYFLCGVGTVLLLISLVYVVRVIYFYSFSFLIVPAGYWGYFWLVYFWYMISKFNKTYTFQQNSGVVILIYFFDFGAACLYLSFLGLLGLSVIKIQYRDQQGQVVLFFVSPVAYIQTVGTIRMFTEDINYTLFSLIVHIPFVIYLASNLIRNRQLILKRRINLIKIKQNILKSAILFNKYNYFDSIKCCICNNRQSNCCIKCQANEWHSCFCFDCLTTYVQVENKNICPRCSKQFKIVYKLKKVERQKQIGQDRQYIKYYKVQQKYDLIFDLQ